MTIRRMPNGEYTNSGKKYCDAWDAFAKLLADMTHTELVAFDPDVVLSDGVGRVCLPAWFVKTFNEASENAKQ